MVNVLKRKLGIYVVIYNIILALSTRYTSTVDKKYGETMLLYHIQPVENKKSVLFIIKNLTNDIMELNYNTGQKYDFEVLKDNEVFWKWSYHCGFTQSLENYYIKPNSTVKYTINLDNLPENISDDLKYRVYSKAKELKDYPPLEGRLGDIL